MTQSGCKINLEANSVPNEEESLIRCQLKDYKFDRWYETLSIFFIYFLTHLS